MYLFGNCVIEKKAKGGGLTSMVEIILTKGCRLAGAPFGAKYWGYQKNFFDEEALKDLKSVIFPVCDEYRGLEPPFLENSKLPSS